MNKFCEYCSHSLDDGFNCLPCVHLEPRPYADNTVVLENLFILSPSIVFCKGTPKWIKSKESEDKDD